MSELSNQTIKGYEIKDVLGEGGFGAVYSAYQPLVRREVAIKVIQARFANQPDFVRRFETEAQLIARLEHLHIVSLYDYWRDQNGAFLVMRMLRGGSLEDVLAAGKKYSLDEALRLVEQVASALHFAHLNQVIHQDLKPANILLDNEGNAYLSDFGIAKDLETEVRAEDGNVVVGTPAYISPEQIQRGTITAQTDIYSLGLIAYEVLTGQPPFTDKTASALILKQLTESVPSVLKFQDDVPRDIDLVIRVATAKDPRNRYPDAQTFAAAFRQAAQGRQSNALKRLVGDASGGVEGITDKIIVPTGLEPFSITPELLELEAPSVTLKNPYKGLRAFQEGDAEDFFGREGLTRRLLERLEEPSANVRFLAVVGPSGSGKSSVVKAGVIPALRRGALPNSEKFFITEMVPGSDALVELESAIQSVAINPIENIGAQLRASEEGLFEVINQILPDDGLSEFFILIDQFEEVFTQTEDNHVRTHFLDSLRYAISHPQSRIRAVITIRADFYDKPLLYPEFGALVRERTEIVLPLNKEELRASIAGPAERAGATVEEELVATIVAEVQDEPGALPLLQYALTETFERRQGRLLTLTSYQASGGVLGSLARRAEELYAELNEDQQEAVRQLFLRLVTLGEGTEDTRRRILYSELAFQREFDDPLQVVLEQFGKYRLLTFDRDPQTREQTVEVAHEALIRQWDRLREWLRNSREDIRSQRRLATAVTEWRNSNQDPSFLASGVRLTQFETLAAPDSDIIITPDERGYIEASIAKREAAYLEEEARRQREIKLERRAARFLRGLVAVMALALVVALGLSVFALLQQQIAEQERDNAQVAQREAERNAEESSSLTLSVQAEQRLDDGDPFLALALALEAVEIDDPPGQAQVTLVNIAENARARQLLLGHGAPLLWAADFSTDGRYAVSSGGEIGYLDDLILWDLETGELLRQFQGTNSIRGHNNRIHTVKFARDGAHILSADRDGRLIEWSIETGEPLREFSHAGAGRIWQLAVSPDGAHLLTGHENGNVIYWDYASGEIVQRFEAHTSAVITVDIHPSGERAISGSTDTRIVEYNLSAGQVIQIIEPNQANVFGVVYALSADNTPQAISAHSNGKIIHWNLADGTQIGEFVGQGGVGHVPTDTVRDVAVHPDGLRVLTASYDGTLVEWQISNRAPLRQFRGHNGQVTSAVYSPDGRSALSTSFDQSVIQWNIDLETDLTQTTRLDGHSGAVNSLDFLPSLNLAVSGGRDREVIIWDTATQNVLQRLAGHNFPIQSVALSADGRYAASGDDSGLLILWDVQSGAEVRRWSVLDAPLRALAFRQTEDGLQILSGGGSVALDADPAQFDLMLWDAESGAEIRRFNGHSDTVYDLAISPDGTRAASASADEKVIIWDVNGGGALYQLEGHTDEVRALAFSPDGAYLLSGSQDTNLILWDAGQGLEVRRFQGHNATVRSVGFSPDGLLAISGAGNVQNNNDNSLILWDVNSSAELRRLQGHSAPVRGSAFGVDSQTVLSASGDAALILWRINTLDELIAWVGDNYNVRGFTCVERELYNIAPRCIAGDLPPETLELENVEPVPTPAQLVTALEAEEATTCPIESPLAAQMINTSAFAAEPPYRIGFSNATDSPRDAFLAAWMQHSSQQNAEIEALISLNAEGDPAAQAEQIAALLEEDLDLLIINPLDYESLASILAALDLPVILVGDAPNNPDLSYLSHVGRSDENIGCYTTAALLVAMDGEGAVIQISGPNDPISQARLNGGRSLYTAYPSVERPRHSYTVDLADAEARVLEMVNAVSSVDGIWADRGTLGLIGLETLTALDRPLVPVTGDALVGLAQFAQTQGAEVILVYSTTHPGQIAIEMALRVLAGETVPRFAEVPLGIIPSNALADFDISDKPAEWHIEDYFGLPPAFWPEAE